MTLAELQKRFQELGAEIRTLLDEAPDGVLDEERSEKVNELKQQRAGVLATIEARQELEKENRRVAETPPGDPSDGLSEEEVRKANDDGATEVRVKKDREADRQFESIGEQCRAVARAAQPGGEIDRRLIRIQTEQRAATGMGETIASEGGFLVEQPLAAGITKRMFETGQILSRVRRNPIGPNANGLRLNKLKEDSRADGSRYGGVRGYWVAEAGQITASQMEFEQIELRLHKVGALLYATQELLDDAVALDSEIDQTVPEELRFQVEEAIVNGDGAGKPLGFTQVPAYLSVAKEGSQTADTVVGANVSKMWGRMLPGSFANAVWLVDQTVLPQLPVMTIGDQPVWQPNFQESPNGLLLGRPIIPIEHLNPVGDLGDIVLADLSQYRFIDKGGIRGAVSMHVRFIYDEQAFRFTYRVDGQPEYRNALTPKSGGDTQSPFIALAART